MDPVFHSIEVMSIFRRGLGSCFTPGAYQGHLSAGCIMQKVRANWLGFLSAYPFLGTTTRAVLLGLT